MPVPCARIGDGGLAPVSLEYLAFSRHFEFRRSRDRWSDRRDYYETVYTRIREIADPEGFKRRDRLSSG
jgi:hypothetical protein